MDPNGNGFGGFGSDASSGVGGGIVITNGGRKKRTKMIVIFVLLVIALGAIVGLSLFMNGKKEAKPLNEPYWAYINYLMRGIDSNEAISRDDYSNSDSAVMNEYAESNEEYFDRLVGLFDAYNDAFSTQSESFKSKYNETINNYRDNLSFVVSLISSNEIEGQGEYFDDLKKLDGLKERYHELISEMGCYGSNKVDMDCVSSKTPSTELLDLMREIDLLETNIQQTSRSIVVTLINQGWNLERMLSEGNQE